MGTRDEYQDFLNGTSRLAGLSTRDWKNPSVVCLPVHLGGWNLGRMRRPNGPTLVSSRPSSAGST
jgi:hypothetical protein